MDNSTSNKLTTVCKEIVALRKWTENHLSDLIYMLCTSTYDQDICLQAHLAFSLRYELKYEKDASLAVFYRRLGNDEKMKYLQVYSEQTNNHIDRVKYIINFCVALHEFLNNISRDDLLKYLNFERNDTDDSIGIHIFEARLATKYVPDTNKEMIYHHVKTIANSQNAST